MQSKRLSPTSGQALIMVTVALVAMSGLIGMAVDFGWSFYVRRAAQSAADAAALGAANAAMDQITSGSITLSSLAGHSSPADCSATFTDPRQNACQYAQQNGFTSGGDSGRQTVTVSADTTSTPPTAPGVNVHYWVTVRITNTIPQLYSAVLGNANATIAARATAAIVDTAVNASVIALDRRDSDGRPVSGVDMRAQDQSTLISAPDGIILSSPDTGAGTTTTGSSMVGRASLPYTLFRTQGSNVGGKTGPGTWNGAIENQGDGPSFNDPMRNLGQPPLTSSSLTPRPVPQGTLNGSVIDPSTGLAMCPGGVCPSGDYFATKGPGDPCPNCASGQPITVSTNLSFAGGSFGDFVFFGGLNVSNVPIGAVDFGPGRYVMVGGFNVQGSTVTGGSGTDAGRLFILTDSNYPGLTTQVSQVTGWLSTNGASTSTSTVSSILYAPSTLSPNSMMTLWGLDATRTLPSDTNAQGSSLSNFGPLLMWQDQQFSDVTYTSNGNVATSSSCGGGGTLDSPCTQTPSTQSPTMQPSLSFGASQSTALHGIVYQPRGSYLQILPSTVVGALQIITGALDIQNYSTLLMFPMSTPPKMQVVALVE